MFQLPSFPPSEALLDLYERYFVPLDAGLEPALKGFIVALLPGLEEGSEFFNRHVVYCT
jgi:hypothetical protein